MAEVEERFYHELFDPVEDWRDAQRTEADRRRLRKREQAGPGPSTQGEE